MLILPPCRACPITYPLALHGSLSHGATTPKNSSPSTLGAHTPSSLHVVASGARTPTAPSSSTITGEGTQGESTPSASSVAGGETGQGAGTQVDPPQSEEKGAPGGNV